MFKINESSKKGLYGKLATVMKAIKRIPKDGYNSFHKYHYTTEATLSEHIRDILVDNGIAFFSSVEEQERNGEFTKVKMRFIIADIETGETLESVYWGEGQDKGDKGLYKAYTGATKYFLMKTFLIPTGDDPEADDEQPKTKTTSTQTTQKKNSPKAEQPNWSGFWNTCKKSLKLSEEQVREMASEYFGQEVDSLKDMISTKAEQLKFYEFLVNKVTSKEVTLDE